MADSNLSELELCSINSPLEMIVPETSYLVRSRHVILDDISSCYGWSFRCRCKPKLADIVSPGNVPRIQDLSPSI